MENKPFTLTDDKLVLLLPRSIHQAEKIVHEICESLPECSLSLQCIKWKYDRDTFTFRDHEDNGKTYVLTMKELLPGYVKYLNYLYEHREHNKLDVFKMAYDPGDWDAEHIDNMIQMAIFGEIIYG